MSWHLGQADARERFAILSRGLALGAQEARAAAPEREGLTLGVFAAQSLALVYTRHLLVHEVVGVAATVHPTAGKVLEKALFHLPVGRALVGLRTASGYFVALLQVQDGDGRHVRREERHRVCVSAEGSGQRAAVVSGFVDCTLTMLLQLRRRLR